MIEKNTGSQPLTSVYTYAHYITYAHATKVHVNVCSEVNQFTILSLSIGFTMYFCSIQFKIFSRFYFGCSVTIISSVVTQ